MMWGGDNHWNFRFVRAMLSVFRMHVQMPLSERLFTGFADFKVRLYLFITYSPYGILSDWFFLVDGWQCSEGMVYIWNRSVTYNIEISHWNTPVNRLRQVAIAVDVFHYLFGIVWICGWNDVTIFSLIIFFFLYSTSHLKVSRIQQKLTFLWIVIPFIVLLNHCGFSLNSFEWPGHTLTCESKAPELSTCHKLNT